MRGFTLVELMIVVAIVAVLAALALPLLADAQARSRFAECALVTDGTGRSGLAYLSENPGGTLWAADNPRSFSAVDKTLVAWSSAGDWAKIEFAPDGSVRCAYTCQANLAANVLQVDAKCDVDGNGNGRKSSVTWTNGLRGATGVYCDGDAPCY